MSEHQAVVGGGPGGWGPDCPAQPQICPSLGEELALALQVFLELMEHGVVSWETLSIPFVKKVGGLFGGTAGGGSGVVLGSGHAC